MNRLCVLFPLVLAGCFGVAIITEPDRHLVDQTQKIGALVKERSSDPVLAQAGAEAEANSKKLKENVTGEPKDPKPYTPENSKDARDGSDAGHKAVGGILDTVWGAAASSLPFTGPIGAAVLTALETVRRLRKKYKPQLEAFHSVVEQIEDKHPEVKVAAHEIINATARKYRVIQQFTDLHDALTEKPKS